MKIIPIYISKFRFSMLIIIIITIFLNNTFNLVQSFFQFQRKLVLEYRLSYLILLVRSIIFDDANKI